MDDDDLYEPKLTLAPPTSPLVRGAAAMVVSVALTACTGNPGAPSHDTGPMIVDAGIWAPPDAGADAPGVDAGNPGLVAVDAGNPDAGNPDTGTGP